MTHVKAGFFDEPDRWTGISHVLEHMFFKGTARRGVGAIARETKSAGGYLNASTSYDHTAYFTVLPASGLAAALDIQADALRHSVIDAGELARELQVIIQEAKRKLDTPSAVAYETLHEVMFDRHRIRRWRIGHEAQLAGFTRDDVHGYYASRYVPERTIVSIVGAVDPEQALALAREAYGDWPAAPGAVDPSPEEPAAAGGARPHAARRREPGGAGPGLARGAAARRRMRPRSIWPRRCWAPGGAAGSTAGCASRASSPGSARTTTRRPSSACSACRRARARRGCRPRSTRIAEAVARLALLGPPPEDLERARTLLRARWARRLESMEGRAVGARAPPRRWTATTCSTASTRRWRLSSRHRCARPPRAISSPTRSPPCSTCPQDEGRSSPPTRSPARSR